MASRPQVISPSRPHATIGKVPPPPRVSNVGRSGPRTTSSMPPVPKVILAWPGREQPWPMSDACWSPAIPAIGGAPSRAVAGAMTPDESTTVGRTASGMRRASSTLVDQPWPSPARSPVMAALDGSVTWTAPSVRCQAIHVSTVPKHRSRLRSGSAWSRRWRTLVAERLGARRMPSACSTRQSPTVRRSCQPSPGPTGSPVARSHTMVEARWLAMPTAVHGPGVGQGLAGTGEGRLGHHLGVELDQAGHR